MGWIHNSLERPQPNILSRGKLRNYAAVSAVSVEIKAPRKKKQFSPDLCNHCVARDEQRQCNSPSLQGHTPPRTMQHCWWYLGTCIEEALQHTEDYMRVAIHSDQRRPSRVGANLQMPR